MAVTEEIKVEFNGVSSGLETSATRAGKAVKKFEGQAADATNTLGNFSRVVEDAPFGFIAISNNLTPLFESFQRLQTQTGSAGGALKAMLGTLSGPAGIGIGLSLVSSALVVFGDKIFGSGEKAEEAASKFDGFTNSLKEIRDRLEEVNSQIDRAAKLGSINIDIFKLPKSLDLKAQVGDVDEKIAAVNESLKKAQKTRQTIDVILAIDEGASFQDLSEQQKELWLSLSEQQRNDIKEMGEAGRKSLREQRVRSLEDEEKYGKDLQSLRDDRKIAARQVNRQQQVEQEDANKKAKEAQDDYLREYKKWLKELEKMLQLQQELKLTGVDPNFVPAPPPPIDEDQNIRRFLDTQRSTLPTSEDGTAMTDLLMGEKMFKDWKEQQDEMKKRLMAQVDLINGALTPAFQDMFAAIIAGEAPMKALFQSLAQSVENLLNKLLATAIEAALISFLIPGAGGFTKVFPKLLGFASGGIVPGSGSGDTVPAMLRPGELVVPPESFNDFAAMMGGPQVIIVGQKLRGRDAYLQQVREQKSQRRLR